MGFAGLKALMSSFGACRVVPVNNGMCLPITEVSDEFISQLFLNKRSRFCPAPAIERRGAAPAGNPGRTPGAATGWDRVGWGGGTHPAGTKPPEIALFSRILCRGGNILPLGDAIPRLGRGRRHLGVAADPQGVSALRPAPTATTRRPESRGGENQRGFQAVAEGLETGKPTQRAPKGHPKARGWRSRVARVRAVRKGRR